MARSSPLERVRRICDKRSFVTYVDNHHDDERLALWCASSSDVQRIGVRLDRDLSWAASAAKARRARST